MSAVTGEMTAPWNETTLPTLLSNYKLENIFNAANNVYQLKRIAYLEKSVLVVRIAKFN